MSSLRNDLNAKIAHMPGVKAAVRDDLESRATRVRAVVADHIHDGHVSASLKVRTNIVDSTVSISDPAIYAINYGHKSRNGSWVEGIHAIEAGL
ncbi:DUF5403 family protein [Streptomyces sp. N2-109]|uniref:DUF5403 family protein n=1 Tax=Streptomyces gossypii TaxID=2883101 RepID=A0ABT2K225_9ACTN|nr:DUF5403 family protein [Streptomyces gossypii]MCT2594225.1 DUF5403 family protein [Streptomyces gossypii]